MNTEKFEHLLALMRWEQKYGDRADAVWYQAAALREAIDLLSVAWPTDEQIDNAREGEDD